MNAKKIFAILIILSGTVVLSSCQVIAPSLPLTYDVGVRQTGSSLEIAMPLCGSQNFSKMSVGFYENYAEKNEKKLWYAKGYQGKIKNGIAYFMVGDRSSWKNTVVPLEEIALHKRIRFVASNGTLGFDSPYVELDKVPISSNNYFVPRLKKSKTAGELECDK